MGQGIQRGSPKRVASSPGLQGRGSGGEVGAGVGVMECPRQEGGSWAREMNWWCRKNVSSREEGRAFLLTGKLMKKAG